MCPYKKNKTPTNKTVSTKNMLQTDMFVVHPLKEKSLHPSLATSNLFLSEEDSAMSSGSPAIFAQARWGTLRYTERLVWFIGSLVWFLFVFLFGLFFVWFVLVCVLCLWLLLASFCVL